MNDLSKPEPIPPIPAPAGEEAALRRLSGYLHDSQRGYEQSRHLTADRFLRIEFSELSEKRARMAKEVDAVLDGPEGELRPRGSIPIGAVHRVFLDLRGNLFGQGRERVLRAVVRNEAALEDAFDDALQAPLSAEVRHLLQRQHRQVRATRDRYAAMLDEDAEMAPVESATGLIGRFNRLTQPVLANPILSAIVVTTVSALTARLLRGRRF